MIKLQPNPIILTVIPHNFNKLKKKEKEKNIEEIF